MSNVVKVNLLVDNPAGVRPGYLNLDPLAPDQDPTGRVKCDLEKLDQLVDPAEVSEFVAHGILDFFPLHRANGVLDHWLSRLAHEGTITLSCVDLLEVTKSLQNRLITIETANILLHGEQDRPWKFRQANYTLNQIAGTLAGKGLRVQQKRINEFKAIVVAQRP